MGFKIFDSHVRDVLLIWKTVFKSITIDNS